MTLFATMTSGMFPLAFQPYWSSHPNYSLPYQSCYISVAPCNFDAYNFLASPLPGEISTLFSLGQSFARCNPYPATHSPLANYNPNLVHPALHCQAQSWPQTPNLQLPWAFLLYLLNTSLHSLPGTSWIPLICSILISCCLASLPHPFCLCWKYFFPFDISYHVFVLYFHVTPSVITASTLAAASYLLDSSGGCIATSRDTHKLCGMKLTEFVGIFLDIDSRNLVPNTKIVGIIFVTTCLRIQPLFLTTITPLQDDTMLSWVQHPTICPNLCLNRIGPLF